MRLSTSRAALAACLTGFLATLVALMSLAAPAQAQEVQHHPSAAGVSSGQGVTTLVNAFSCDWYTHTCVKFNKSETKQVASKFSGSLAGVGPFIATFCGKIPHALGKAACAAVVGLVGYKLGSSFKSAAKSGKCVEVHFTRGVGVAAPWWKTEGC